MAVCGIAFMVIDEGEGCVGSGLGGSLQDSRFGLEMEIFVVLVGRRGFRCNSTAIMVSVIQ
jgi:hypothetical protein